MLVHWPFENPTCLVNLTYLQDSPLSVLCPFGRHFQSNSHLWKPRTNGSCFCPLFSCSKLSFHCWSSASKGQTCQLIHSDKRLSYVSPRQSNDVWHHCPTCIILWIVLNPEFTSTTQRRKLLELSEGEALNPQESPHEDCLQQQPAIRRKIRDLPKLKLASTLAFTWWRHRRLDTGPWEAGSTMLTGPPCRMPGSCHRTGGKPRSEEPSS